MPRAFVTGAGGALGSQLVELLDREGHEVIAPSSSEVDVRDASALAAAVAGSAPELVFHLAGTRAGGPCALAETNVVGFANLADALAGSSARVVVAGSSAQYGLRETTEPLTEDEPQRPEGWYGATKAAQETLARTTARDGVLDTVCVRLFNLVGARQRAGLLPADLALQLVGAAPDSLVARHLVGVRDFVDHADAARALLTVAQLGERGAVYNVAGGRAVSLRELAETLLELDGRGVPLVDLGEFDPERSAVNQVGDASRLEGLGWHPEVDLRTSLASLLASVSA